MLLIQVMNVFSITLHCEMSVALNMVSYLGRLVLIILLLTALHVVWMLEQPSGSTDIFPYHPRMNWLMNEILFVPRLYFCPTTLGVDGVMF